MVVALTLALALIFSSAQVYRINSVASDVQEVADACALAAENQVAEFMIAVRVCDAISLSLSLLAVVSYGAGVVAACVPAAAGVSSGLVDFGGKVLSARNSFAEKAARGLTALQQALPFLAAAQAYSVASANGDEGGRSEYYAAVVLVPATGPRIEVAAAEGAAELGEQIEANADGIREQAQAAEDAAAAASEAKKRGFAHDCGDSPGYCLHERAEHLAALPANENPFYRSVDAWSFSVALKRAQAYYAARYEKEDTSAGSVSDQADAVLRKRFYAYAADELARGYVIDSDDEFDALFPALYCNIEEMRSTSLYTESVYPVTQEGDRLIMHAWEGCPGAAGFVETGSVERLETESESFDTCPLCAFTPSSVGSVAAASTSISNGFEHHYREVARAAEDYKRARDELDPLTRAVKDDAGGLLERCATLVGEFGGRRIEAKPPGYLGAVAMVVDVGRMSADAGFESLFVRGGRTLGTRAAVSGATLIADASQEGATVISSLLDGFSQDAGAVVGAARVVLACWSNLLRAFSEGQEALVDAVEAGLDALPLASESGLGDWAAGKLSTCMAEAGLAPARLDVLKPVIVNTGHVVAGDMGRFSVAFSEVKSRALSASSSSTDLFTALVDGVESEAYEAVEKVEEGVVVAVVEFPVGDVTLPITLTVPSGVVDQARGFLAECFDAVRSAAGSITGIRVWS